jgi:hypothetical protein
MQYYTPGEAIDEKLFESLLFLFALLYTEARYAHTLRTFPDYLKRLSSQPLQIIAYNLH